MDYLDVQEHLLVSGISSVPPHLSGMAYMEHSSFRS